MTALLNKVIKDSGFEDEVQALRTLHRLATDWEDIRGRFDEFDGIDDLAALLNAIAARNTGVQQALTALNVDSVHLEVLSRFLGRLQARLDDIDPSIQKLLRPAGDFAETDSSSPGLVELPLLSAEKSGAGNTDLRGMALDFNLSGAASTSLAAEAGDLLPLPDAASPGRHLRVSTMGVVSAGAGASVPFTGGKFEAGVQGEAGAELSYFFASQANSLYAVELARCLPHLPAPFDYSSVVGAMRDHQLDALHLKVNGVTSGKVSLAISQATQLFNPAVPVDIRFQFSATAKRSGVFDVVLGAKRNASGQLTAARMLLTRASSRETATSFGMSVTVDSGELFEALRGNIEGLLGDYQSLVKEYEEYLTPGTWLKTRLGDWAGETLQEWVRDPAIRDAIGAAFGNPTATRKFTDLISGTLEKAANSITGFYDHHTGQVNKALRDQMSANLPPVLLNAIGPRLDSLVGDAVHKVRAGLKERIDSIVSTAEDTADEHIDRMNELTGPVRDAIDSAAGKADQLFEGVRQVLSEIEKNLQKLHDAAAKLAHSKLTIAWSESTRVTEGRSIEFDASLPVSGDLAAFDQVYDDLMRGSMDEVARLLDHPQVRVHSQALEAYATWRRESVFSVVFMDTLLEHSTILNADCRIRLEGESIAVGTETSLEEWSRDKHQQQTATFLNVVDLAVARAQPRGIVRQFQLRLGLRHEEDRFRELEVRNFLGEFESIGALRAGATDRAVAAMQEASLIEPNGILRTTVGLAMSLDERGLANLLHLGRSVLRGPWPNNFIRPRVFRLGLPVLKATGTFDRRFKGADKAAKRLEFADEVLDVMAGAVGKAVDTELQKASLLMHYRALQDQQAPPRLTAQGDRLRKRGEFVVDLLIALVEALSLLREIWISNPAREMHDEKWYRDRQRVIVDSLDRWMNTGFALVGGWKDGKPRHETVAFCGLIGRLAGSDDEPVRMGITIEAPGREETIIIQ